MSEQPNGGPAFPESYTGPDRPHEGMGGGMTLLDYFAAKAMQSLSATQDSMAAISKQAKLDGVNSVRFIAAASYDFADAMLAEREKRFGGAK